MPAPTGSTATTSPTATSALAAGLRVGVLRLARRLRSESADSQLTLTQVAALATLERHGPLSPGELAAHERVKAPSMTRVLATLGEAGLVDREPHPSDGRQVVVRVSTAGGRLLAQDRARREAWLARRLDELDAHDLGVLRAALPVLERVTAA